MHQNEPFSHPLSLDSSFAYPSCFYLLPFSRSSTRWLWLHRSTVWLRGSSTLHNASLPLLVDALIKVIDEAFVDFGKVECKTLGMVGIAGLYKLKIILCTFLNI